ncbi:MAG: hypothetical protein HYS12_24845 [Planctomycetes bacterium]|nr:hypothetical protein [Planctomycetota bacterium]
MKFVARLAVAALSGAVIAAVLAALVGHALFAAGGYTEEALGDPPPWVGFAILGSGAVVAMLVVLFAGRSSLPEWVRPSVLGGLAGVAVVVFLTLLLANALGGPSPKSPKGEGIRLFGLVCGVPIGLISGIVVGLEVSRKRRG